MRQQLQCRAFRSCVGPYLIALVACTIASAAFAGTSTSPVSVVVESQAPGQAGQKTAVCVSTNEQVRAPYTRSSGKPGAVTFYVQPAPPGEPEGVPVHFDWKLSQLFASDVTAMQANGIMGYAVSDKPLKFTFGLKPDSVDARITITPGCKG
jgi:hypothetical protein